MKHYQIALDGPAGAGKSTLAKKLAAQLDFIYINSGGIYRSIAVALRDNNTDITDLKEVAKVLENSRVVQKGSRMFLNGQDINDRCYTQDIQNFVPLISPIHIIREASTKSQILTAANNNIVIEGRDTTTVVFPNATLKVFVTASQELRAQRRWEQSGKQISLEETLKDLIKRDSADMNRSESPLKQADDAFVLDTTNLTEKEALDILISEFNKRK